VPEPCFDLNLLDPHDPFEIDGQVAHLFKQGPLGVEDVYEVWASNPSFYPAQPPADWLMVAEVCGEVLLVVLMPSRSSPTKCRPIGVYRASRWLEHIHRKSQ